MMTPLQVMQVYEGISRLMGEMVVAAQAHEWERLRKLEACCRPLTHRLMADESGVDLSEDMKRDKFLLLRKILDDDAAIRAVTQPWMDELQARIGVTRARQKLTQTYGAAQG